MKKFLQLSMAILIGASMNAATVQTSLNNLSHRPHNVAVDFKTVTETGITVEAGTPAKVVKLDRKTRAEEEEEPIGLITVNMDFSGTDVKCGGIKAFTDDNECYDGQLRGKLAYIDVPGCKKFTVIATFYTYKLGVTGKYNNLCGLSYVVKENVEVGADEEVIMDIAASDACNEYKIRNYLPNGEEARIGSVTYTSKTDYEIQEEGNALFIGVYPAIYHKDHGSLMWLSVASKWNILENEFKNSSDIDDFLVIKVNDLSDDIIVGAECIVNTGTAAEHDDFLIEHFEKGTAIATKGEYANDPADYHEMLREFVGTSIAANAEYTYQGNPYSMTVEKFWNGRYVGGMGTTMGRAFVCIPQPSKHIPELLQSFQYDYFDLVTDVYNDGTILWQTGWASSASRMVLMPEGNFLQMVRTNDQLYEVQEPQSIYDWTHPIMRTDVEDILDPLGSSPCYVSTLNAFMYDEWEEKDVLYVTPDYKGYGQESVWTLYATNDFKGFYNDTEVPQGLDPWDETPNVVNGWTLYEWTEKGFTSGKSEFFFQSKPNKVNGVDYNTSMHLLFDTSKEDFVCPMLQHMTIKNSDGEVTYRLSDTNGVIQMVAGDFVRDADGMYRPSENPIEPTVRYSVSGTDRFHDMKVDACPGPDVEYPYFAPAHQIDLKQIDDLSATGWYDLYISMEDAEGNFMEQTISPAFYITPPTKVNLASSDAKFAVRISGRDINVLGADNALIHVYTADGRTVTSHTGASASLHGLVNGVYMIEVEADGAKKVVKAVIR